MNNRECSSKRKIVLASATGLSAAIGTAAVAAVKGDPVCQFAMTAGSATAMLVGSGLFAVGNNYLDKLNFSSGLSIIMHIGAAELAGVVGCALATSSPKLVVDAIAGFPVTAGVLCCMASAELAYAIHKFREEDSAKLTKSSLPRVG